MKGRKTMLNKNLFQMNYMSDSCGCGCGHSKEHSHDHEHGEGCGCGHDHAEMEHYVTMVDEETGEEFRFFIADDFEYKGEIYCVLLTTEDEPEAVIVRVVEDEDGEHFLSLTEEECDEVYAEYDRLLTEDEAWEDEE